MLNILIERQKLLNVHDLEVGRLFSVDKLERERMRMAPAHVHDRDLTEVFEWKIV